MEVPEDLRYTKEHEWVRHEGNAVTIGISDYAQSELGDIVFVELPEPAAELSQSEEMGVVESVKAASDFYAPVSGKVVERNDALSDSPELINKDPYGDGWIVKIEISDEHELHGLLSAAEYEGILEE